jgi:hypothetical protein
MYKIITIEVYPKQAPLIFPLTKMSTKANKLRDAKETELKINYDGKSSSVWIGIGVGS